MSFCVIFTERLNYEKNATILSKAGGRALGSIIAKYKLRGLWVIQHLRNYTNHQLPLFWTTLQRYGLFHGIIAWRQFKIEPYVYI